MEAAAFHMSHISRLMIPLSYDSAAGSHDTSTVYFLGDGSPGTSSTFADTCQTGTGESRWLNVQVGSANGKVLSNGSALITVITEQLTTAVPGSFQGGGWT